MANGNAVCTRRIGCTCSFLVCAPTLKDISLADKSRFGFDSRVVVIFVFLYGSRCVFLYILVGHCAGTAVCVKSHRNIVVMTEPTVNRAAGHGHYACIEINIISISVCRRIAVDRAAVHSEGAAIDYHAAVCRTCCIAAYNAAVHIESITSRYMYSTSRRAVIVVYGTTVHIESAVSADAIFIHLYAAAYAGRGVTLNAAAAHGERTAVDPNASAAATCGIVILNSAVVHVECTVNQNAGTAP